MADYWSDSESDEEPLNLKLFMRKSYGFIGLPEDTVDVLRRTVTGLGATCDDSAKYVFTTAEHFYSITNCNVSLYNVTYIRDCIDANRCLNIDHYKFELEFVQKKNFKDFDPCCNQFHNCQNVCVVCDPKFESNKFVSRESKKERNNKLKPKIKETKKEKQEISNLRDPEPPKFDRNNPYHYWEDKCILDYIISNDFYGYCKAPHFYKHMEEKKILKNRSAESMRRRFYKTIIKSINLYNLPKPVQQKFKQIDSVSGICAVQKLFKIKRRDKSYNKT